MGRVFERFIRANPQRFGEGCPVPRLVAKTQPPKDVEASGKRITTGRELGLKVPKKWAYQELEIPEPKEGEEVLEAAPRPSATPTEPNEKRNDAPDEMPPKTPAVSASRVALAADATETIYFLGFAE